MTLLSLIRRIAPETANLDDNVVQEFAELATLQSCFGNAEIKKLARAYLAAHMITMSGRAGSGGEVSSLKEGDLSISYATSNDVASVGSTQFNRGYPYSSTSYGREYKRLMDEQIIKARTRLVGAYSNGSSC